jgi:hypothetical protein
MKGESGLTWDDGTAAGRVFRCEDITHLSELPGEVRSKLGSKAASGRTSDMFVKVRWYRVVQNSTYDTASYWRVGDCTEVVLTLNEEWIPADDWLGIALIFPVQDVHIRAFRVAGKRHHYVIYHEDDGRGGLAPIDPDDWAVFPENGPSEKSDTVHGEVLEESQSMLLYTTAELVYAEIQKLLRLATHLTNTKSGLPFSRAQWRIVRDALEGTKISYRKGTDADEWRAEFGPSFMAEKFIRGRSSEIIDVKSNVELRAVDQLLGRDWHMAVPESYYRNAAHSASTCVCTLVAASYDAAASTARSSSRSSASAAASAAECWLWW